MNQYFQSRDAYVCITNVIGSSDDTMKKGQIYDFWYNYFRPTHCLVYVSEGEAKYFFTKDTETVRKGDLILLARGDPYYFEVLSERYSYSYVEFAIENNGSLCSENTVFRLQNPKSLQMIFEKLVSIFFYKKPGYQLEAASHIYYILHKIILNEHGKYLLSNRYLKIKQSVEYLSEHFADRKLSIEQVAALSGLSERQFRRIFSEIYSMSPVRYLNLLKIDRSKDLLSNPILTVTEIAEQVGYANVYYFSKQFKAETGETPTQYRDNHYSTEILR